MNATDLTFFDLISNSLSDATNAEVNPHLRTLPTTPDDWQYLHKTAVSQKLWPVILKWFPIRRNISAFRKISSQPG